MLNIGDRRIGPGHACFIIAEAGVNHNGDPELAKKLIEKASEAGADCVKFQTFKAEEVATANAPKADYQLQVTEKSESQLQMLRKLELPRSAYTELMEFAERKNILFLSTPYSTDDAKFLDDCGVAAFKIASGQIVEPSFLEYVADFQKPLLISTGMATLAEVYQAVELVRRRGNEQIALLQCTTNYPSQASDANLRVMSSLNDSLQVVTGYSDHVRENFVAFAAAALGASIIEKHFTLDRRMAGPDHSCSLEPEELRELIHGIREIEKSLGSGIKSPTESEVRNSRGMRRSITICRAVSAGEIIRKDDLCFKRPATGLAPALLSEIIGRRYAVDLPVDSILNFEDITWLRGERK